jgi:hypothetical protein
MPSRASHPSSDKEARVGHLVGDVFREGGWKVRVQPAEAGMEPDVIAERAGKKYVIAIKRASEGRKDRIIPLLSEAILQAQSYARLLPGRPAPVAVVVAGYIPESVAEQAKEFARQHAPKVAVGFVDFEGFRSFAGRDLERLNSARQKRRMPVVPGREPRPAQLFSDLNQWMLKVVLAPGIPDSYLAAPRGRYQGAAQLAAAADVSVMSAFRFVEQFLSEGFLEQDAAGLHIVRSKELMDRWLAANQRRVPEIAARWILGGGKKRLRESLRSYLGGIAKASRRARRSESEHVLERSPRVCLGLFAAAEALGFGFVHGLQPYLYMERPDQQVLEKLGLSAIGGEQNPDVYVRIPKFREAVFRGAVAQVGVLAADIFQVWLDVAEHPSRGREQADLIYRRVLAPVLEARA